MLNPNDVGKLERICYLFTQSIVTLVKMEGMKVTNEQKRQERTKLTYGEKDFCNLLDEHGLYHNSVINYLYSD